VKKLLVIMLSIMLVSLLLPVNSVIAFPAAHLFYGDVTIDGSPAPNGTYVTATMAGYSDFSTTTNGDYYELTINGDTADDGKAISFFVDGIPAGSAIVNLKRILKRI